jgi:hypothetical protein
LLALPLLLLIGPTRSVHALAAGARPLLRLSNSGRANPKQYAEYNQ